MKTVLITGGAGFLGSHLCDRFIKEGYRVLCLDNFITGDMENINHLLKNKQFSLIEHDMSKPIEINESIHYVLHFASPASPIDYLKLPIQTLKVGALGTHNALGITLRHNATMLLASTSEVYGDPLVHPQSEDYWGNVNPIGPRGVYDEAKRFAEAMTLAYQRYHNLKTRIVRIFNTYGPRMRLNDGRAIPAFISQCLQNKDITVFGDGSQTRSFCYVSDQIEGIYSLLMSNCDLPVNIGNPDEMSLLDLAESIKKFTGSKSEIVFESLPIDDPKVRQPDITKAREDLKWEPRVSFEEGMKKTIEFSKIKLEKE
ncbi:UDP-glucuronic acid decarboxylase family protein [Candidatus Omnitrophota bacterium]